jgi:trimeric autotransporter adhesin
MGQCSAVNLGILPTSFSLSLHRRFSETRSPAVSRVNVRGWRVLFLLLLFAVPSVAQQLWVINTFAGGGPTNVPAASASTGSILGVALDAAGNVYFSGYDTHQVWEISGGNVIVVAGNGSAGGSLALDGDGGPATQATLLPYAFTLDSAGEMYIADWANGLIRKVGTNGIITTVAGSGARNNVGDCLFDGDGPALQHTLCEPTQVVLDAQGDMFIADQANMRIRKVDTLGNMTTVAGDGALNVYGQCVFDGDGPATSHSLCYPSGVAVDTTGNLYVADMVNSLVRKVDTSGNMTTFAGDGTAGFSGDGGPATSAMLNGPWSVVLDSAGDLYISDSANYRIREVDTGGNISTIAGNGNCPFDGDGPAAQHNICPLFIARDTAGDFFFGEDDFVHDPGIYRVREIDAAGNLTTLAGNGTLGDISFGQPAVQEPAYTPISVAVDPGGNVYANLFNQFPSPSYSGIVKVDGQGVISAVTAPAGGQPYGPGGSRIGIPDLPDSDVFWLDAGFAVDAAGDVFSVQGNQVFKTDSQGNTVPFAGIAPGAGACQFDGDGPATSHSLCLPTGVAVDASGNVFIADTSNCLIREVSPSGNMTTIAGTIVSGVSNCNFNGDGPATSHSLNWPAGVAVDNIGNVYVADTYNYRVREINLSASTLTTIAGSGMLTSPHQCVFDGDGTALQHSVCGPNSVAVDSSGNVYVADVGNVRVREISGGNITTLAGTGAQGFAGEGGPAASAAFMNPVGVAVDATGAVYVADAYNNRVRRLSQSSTFTMVSSQTWATVSAGATATYGVQLLAANGFGGTVSLSCSGAPKGTTCTPSASSVSVSSGGSTPAAFNVTTTPGSGSATMPFPWANPPATGPPYISLAYLGLVAIGLIASMAGRRKLGLVLAAGMLLLMLGCGGSASSSNSAGTGGGGTSGGGSTPATAPGTYPLILTAASGGVTQNTTVMLQVQ